MLEPAFFIRWLNFLDNYIVQISFFFIGLASIFLLSARGKATALGLWIGYGITGLLLPALIVSHNYYSLPLIPAIAFSLAPLASPIGQVLSKQHKLWQAALFGVVILALAYSGWNSRVSLVAEDYRQEPPGWQAIARELPTDGRIIAIAHDYGHRLRYYGWVSISRWPTSAELNLNVRRGSDPEVFASMFTQMTEGYDYFLITLHHELDTQPLLSQMLFDNYPLLVDKDEYLLFDLRPSP